MKEYKLNLSNLEEESKQQAIDDITQFIKQMDMEDMLVVTLTAEQSNCWDEEGDIDYQDEYGQQIIQQIDDDTIQSLLIRNIQQLPVALAIRNNNGGWQAIGIAKKLRHDFAGLFNIDDENLENL